jgi:hypothetical protein
MYPMTSQRKFISDSIRDLLAPGLLRHRLPSRVTVPAFLREIWKAGAGRHPAVRNRWPTDRYPVLRDFTPIEPPQGSGPLQRLPVREVTPQAAETHHPRLIVTLSFGTRRGRNRFDTCVSQFAAVHKHARPGTSENR